MKKGLYFFLVLFTVGCVWNLYDRVSPKKTVNASVNVKESIGTVFREYHIEDELCIVDGNYYYGDEYINEMRARQILDNIALELGMNSSYMYDAENVPGKYIYKLSKEGKNSKVKIELTTVEEQESENVISQRSYITVNMEIRNSLESGFYYKNLLERIMNGKEKKENTFLLIQGKMRGETDLEEEITGKISEKLGAEKVMENTKDGYNYYGYVEGIKNYISIGKSKINLNIAYSYDEKEDMTNVYIGSPIVNYDY